MGLITISEDLGSGGIEIARQVAGKLNIELYDDERLQAEAIKSDIGIDDFSRIDKKAPGFFDRIMGRKPDMYLDLMEAVVFEASRSGNGVIIGHGSQLLLRDFGCALHVRIQASREDRIQKFMSEQNLSRENAGKLIRKIDSQRSGFFKYAFRRDLNDPSLYDLIINTEKIAGETAVELIVDMAASDEISACSLTALESMEKMSQAKQVEAVLLANDINVNLLHIEVPQKGRVHITGLTSTQDERERILSAVNSLKEITQCDAHIAVANAGF